MRSEISDVMTNTDDEARAQRLRRLAKKRGLILTLLPVGYVLVPATAVMTLDEVEFALKREEQH